MISSAASNVTFENPKEMDYCNNAITIHGHSNKDTYLCLETFSQQEYDQVICLDSDMLCINDLSEIMSDEYSEYPIMGCNKGNEYRKRGVDRDSQPINTLRQSGSKFNAGFMAVNSFHLKDDLKTYNDLKNIVRVATSGDNPKPFNDQDAIVQYWLSRPVFILPDFYNWKMWGAIGGSKEIEEWGRKQDKMFRDNINNIKIIHYSGKRKPWGNKTKRGDKHNGKYDVCSVGDHTFMKNTLANKIWHEYWEECFGEKFKTDWYN